MILSHIEPTPVINCYSDLADTATSHSYFKLDDAHHCTAITNADGPNVKVENGNIISLRLQALVTLVDELLETNKQALLFDELKTRLLVFIGQHCNDDFIAIFSKFHMKIITHNKIVITCIRNQNGLWDIPIKNKMTTPPSTSPPSTSPSSPTVVANNIIKVD